MSKRRFSFLLVLSLAWFLAIAISPISAADEEALGRKAEEAGKLRLALTHYVSALQSASEGSSTEQRLREKIIRLAPKIQPPPAVPEEAERQMARGRAAVKAARDEQGFMRAAKEFGKGLNVAPWLVDGYYNLGVVLDKAGKYDEAIKNLKLYLVAFPAAKDAKNLIYEIEYRKEEATRQKTIEARKRLEEQRKSEAASRFSGSWQNWVHTMSLDVSPSKCNVLRSGVGSSNGVLSPNEIRIAKWCKFIDNRLQVQLYGHYRESKYGFSYSVVCEFSLDPDGNGLTGRYVSGARGSQDARLCTSNKFRRID